MFLIEYNVFKTRVVSVSSVEEIANQFPSEFLSSLSSSSVSIARRALYVLFSGKKYV